jgi:tripartite-type tricarboxylate transporter receptor subunit TctC
LQKGFSMFRWLALCSLLMVSTAAAQKETYPNRPITIVVTAAAGGVSDVIARAVASRLSPIWGQQIVIENRGGAAHTLGAAQVARAAPDGHTLMVAESGTFVTNSILYGSKLPYNVDDITPITGLIRIHHAIQAHPSLPANNVRELAELGKKQPGQIAYGTTGIGAASHLNIARLESISGAKFVTVHYRGAAPAFNDVLAGHVKFMLTSVATGVQPHKDGRIKMLGVGSAARLPSLPNIPTFEEAGFPGYRAGTWFGLAAPTGTPPAIIAKINADVLRIINDPQFRAKFLEPQLFEAIGSSAAQFTANINDEAATWRKVIADSKITIQ